MSLAKQLSQRANATARANAANEVINDHPAGLELQQYLCADCLFIGVYVMAVLELVEQISAPFDGIICSTYNFRDLTPLYVNLFD